MPEPPGALAAVSAGGGEVTAVAAALVAGRLDGAEAADVAEVRHGALGARVVLGSRAARPRRTRASSSLPRVARNVLRPG